MNKVVIAVVPGWAVGGGHSLHVVCDMTIASKEHAVFKQTDADVASFDGGFGSAYLARQVGQKRAREIFFLSVSPPSMRNGHGQCGRAARQAGANGVRLGEEWRAPAIKMLIWDDSLDEELVGAGVCRGGHSYRPTFEKRRGKDAL